MAAEAYFSIGLAPDRVAKRPIKRILTPQAKTTTWRILPSSACLSGRAIFCVDTLKGKYFFNKVDSLKKQEILAQSWALIPFYQEMKVSFQLVYSEAMMILNMNQRLRVSFKKILNAWRFKHIRTMNENDPITLCKPIHPVYIVEPCLKIQFVYEAETCALDFHKRLLDNDGQVPEPHKPRNPLTNKPLSVFQIISVFAQCKSYGFTYWTLESYKKSKCSIKLFERNYRPILRYTTIVKIVNSENDEDGRDTLIDFIQTQFDSHNIEYPKKVFSWAFNIIPNDEYLRRWRKLCIQWYSVYIFDDPDIHGEGWLQIEKKSMKLCSSWREIQDKYLESIQSKRLFHL